jgi:hypothetical protein
MGCGCNGTPGMERVWQLVQSGQAVYEHAEQSVVVAEQQRRGGGGRVQRITRRATASA